jgi:hypothetical protein
MNEFLTFFLEIIYLEYIYMPFFSNIENLEYTDDSKHLFDMKDAEKNLFIKIEQDIPKIDVENTNKIIEHLHP